MFPSIPPTDEQYREMLALSDKIGKQVKSPSLQVWSPNTGFALVRRHDDRNVVERLGAKAKLEKYLELVKWFDDLEQWSCSENGKPFTPSPTLTMVKLDENTRVDQHYEGGNTYSYIR